MLARRLLVLAGVLLALGAVAASLAPRDLREPGSTTRAAPVAPPPPAGARTGRELALTLDAGAARAGTASARVGDHVRLSVRGAAPDTVSIPQLGQTQPVDPYSPAVFDFVADRAGSFPVLLVQAQRRAGTLRIAPNS